MKKNGAIKLLLKIYTLVVSVFFMFRLILFIVERDRVDFNEVNISTIFKAFIMGVRFDIVITGYILILPALIFFIMEVFNLKSKFIMSLFFYWVLVFFSFSFVIAAVDIPYFSQFYSRFSVSAFEWFDSPSFVFNMIIQEPKYFLIILPLLFFITVFYKILKRIFKNNTIGSSFNIGFKLIFSILFLGVIFLGIRGRLEQKSPIRIGTAYFSNHSFLNQMGLNPVFTLLRSYLDSQEKDNNVVKLMDDNEAIKAIQKNLKINNINELHPILRTVTPDTIAINQPNIVMVIMEAMSAGNMERNGNKNNLTPFLDSLATNSIYFDNIYTAGKHTFNGVFSTLFSMPSLYRQHPMKRIKTHYGISHALRKNGYSTTFMINHDSQFDNIEGFLRANAFDEVIGQSNYPSSEVKTTLGVPDDFMFRYSMNVMDKLHAKKKPFFLSFMTASNHGPFYVPEYFSPKSSKIKSQVIEYADWSIKKLITLASTKEWFDNTIFVFIADHGAAMKTPYDISLDYHHSPLIYYAPKLLTSPQIHHQIGGQIDVFPTLMGLLKQPYLNNTLGIDLLKEKRPFIFINDDDKVGVLNDSLFLIMKPKEKSKLYKYKNRSNNNVSSNYPKLTKDMEVYVKENLQTYQYLLLHDKTLSVNE